MTIDWDAYDRKPSLLNTQFGYTERKRPSKRVQKAYLDEHGPFCRYCDDYLTPSEYRWDHIKPFSLIGTNPDDNWALACQRCNGRKGSLVFESVEDARAWLRRNAA